MSGNHEGLNQFKKVDKGMKFCCTLRHLETRIFSGCCYTFSFTIVNTTPSLKDLYQYITPQYAVDWKVIGILLGLPDATIDIIEHDNHFKARECCNAMLREWLLVDTTASWRKLFTVIESPPVSCCAPDKGD